MQQPGLPDVRVQLLLQAIHHRHRQALQRQLLFIGQRQHARLQRGHGLCQRSAAGAQRGQARRLLLLRLLQRQQAGLGLRQRPIHLAQRALGLVQPLGPRLGQLPGQRPFHATQALGQRGGVGIGGVQRLQIAPHALQPMLLLHLAHTGQRCAIVGLPGIGHGLLQLGLRAAKHRKPAGVVLRSAQRGWQALFEGLAAQRQQVVEGRQGLLPTLQVTGCPAQVGPARQRLLHRMVGPHRGQRGAQFVSRQRRGGLQARLVALQRGGQAGCQRAAVAQRFAGPGQGLRVLLEGLQQGLGVRQRLPARAQPGIGLRHRQPRLEHRRLGGRPRGAFQPGHQRVLRPAGFHRRPAAGQQGTGRLGAVQPHPLQRRVRGGGIGRLAAQRGQRQGQVGAVAQHTLVFTAGALAAQGVQLRLGGGILPGLQQGHGLVVPGQRLQGTAGACHQRRQHLGGLRRAAAGGQQLRLQQHAVVVGLALQRSLHAGQRRLGLVQPAPLPMRAGQHRPGAVAVRGVVGGHAPEHRRCLVDLPPIEQQAAAQQFGIRLVRGQAAEVL